jgi:sugar-specific transcriptional regulator TrmB
MDAHRPSGRKADLSDLDPAIVEGLAFLGLTAYEIRVYDAVLRHPRSRVPEIARESRVPQPKVYATIKRLSERGLVQSHLGSVNEYSALEPREGFESLMAQARSREAAASQAIGALQELHESAEHGMSRREGRVKLFQGIPAAARDFRELVSQGERDIAIVVRFPLVVADYLDDARRIVDAGGRVRMLVECEPEPDARVLEFVEAATATGAKLRRSKHVPMRMAMFDRRILVLPMNDPSAQTGDGFTMLEVRNPELCHSFEEIFDLLWRKANPFHSVSEDSPRP